MNTHTHTHLIAILLFLGLGQFVFAAEVENPTVYQVMINGREYQLKESQEERLVLDGGKEIDIKITVNPVQAYQLREVQFKYTTGLSLTDDNAPSERTITLVHASGCGVVITEQGRAKDISQKQLLKNLVDGMLEYAKKGVAKKITRNPTELVTFSTAVGSMTTSTHFDEDNDKLTYYYYVLQCGDHVTSIIGFHYQDGESIYSTIQKTILESMKKI